MSNEKPAATNENPAATPAPFPTDVDLEEIEAYLDRREREGGVTTVIPMVSLRALVRRARAAPAPGTATREEFERLVSDLVCRAYELGAEAIGATDIYVARREAKDAARASLLRYEERLRGERDRARLSIVRQDACIDEMRAERDAAEQATEEATARVERLEKVLRRAEFELRLHGAWSILDAINEALGVPTSAADGRSGR